MRRRLEILGIAVALFVCGVFVLLAANWPFTREATTRSLEQVSLSQVRIGHFQKTFFPNPGYIASDVTFSRGSNATAKPIAIIGKIVCRATWPSILTFTHRINRMNLEHVRVSIPPQVPPAIRRHPASKIKTTVSELFANGAVLEIAPRHEGAQTMRFDFHELALSNLAANKPVHFRTLARIPTPSADLQTYGTFGPLKRGDVAATALSGSFQLRQGDLSSYKMIGGIFTAAGRFKGTLGRVELAGTTQIPNFEVTSARHPLALSAEYETIVNGTSGDVTIASAAVHFLDSTLSAQGSISGRHGKTVSLDVGTRAGRVQDLLRLFVSSDKPPLKGVINFHAHVVLPPIHERFLKKVRLDGEFDITGGEFVKPGSQRKVDELSARASGKKALIKTMGGPPRVSSEWKATVRLRDAVARMSNATFAVPGAVSRGSGTYDLPRQAINLAGHLVMDASLSKAASGVKSLLLIPLDPFFKKRGAGAVVPVRVMGTYSHPRFKASLREHK